VLKWIEGVEKSALYLGADELAVELELHEIAREPTRIFQLCAGQRAGR